ncbi:MAG: hypothetical protein GY719_25580 [bacterium]|nr:hypothetical protein [bacterium]
MTKNRFHQITSIALASTFLVCLMLAPLPAEAQKPGQDPTSTRITIDHDDKVQWTEDFVGKRGGFADLPFAQGYTVRDLSLVSRQGYVSIEYMDIALDDGERAEFTRFLEGDKPIDTVADFIGNKIGYSCQGKTEYITVHDIELAATSGNGIAVTYLAGENEAGEAIEIEIEEPDPLCATINYTVQCKDIGNTCGPAPRKCNVTHVITPNGPRFSCTCSAGPDTCILVVTFTCKDTGCALFGGECKGRSIVGDNQPHPASPTLPDDGCFCDIPVADAGDR